MPQAGLIVEGIVTTQSAAGETNIAPMGPIVDANWSHMTLRPFQTSTTYANLRAGRQGVFHVTDDVLLLARAAIGRLEPQPALVQCPAVAVPMLADACRWYAFRVEQLDDAQERTTIECRIVAAGQVRDFLGFNRAKHAVVEAAILATRVHLLPGQEIVAQLAQLAAWVDKTGGDQERRAFDLLREYVDEKLHAQQNTACHE